VQNDAATIPNYVELTSDVVSAYVSNNSVSPTDLPGPIGSTVTPILALRLLREGGARCDAGGG